MKELVWAYVETGPHAGSIIPVLHDYLPQDAPERLLPHPHVEQAAAGVSTGRALEAALATALLGALLAFLLSLLALRRRRQPSTPSFAEDPAAPIVVADFPGFPHPEGPSCSHSSFVTKTEAFLRFCGVPYSKQVVRGRWHSRRAACEHISQAPTRAAAPPAGRAPLPSYPP